TFILKFALINTDTDVLSAGLAVTAATGQSIRGEESVVPHGTLIQPYLGFLRDFGGFYVHGFSSLVLSTDDREPTLWFNDIGLGYRLLERPAGLVRGVVPTIEAHLTTPLNHRDPQGFTSASDLLVLTGGVHFQLGARTTFTLGLGTPVTGPRLFD